MDSRISSGNVGLVTDGASELPWQRAHLSHFLLLKIRMDRLGEGAARARHVRTSICQKKLSYRIRDLVTIYKLAALRNAFFVPTFFQYNRRLVRQRAVGAWLYMPHDGDWLASFEDIPPQNGFSAARTNVNSGGNRLFLYAVPAQKKQAKVFFGRFLRNFVERRSRVSSLES